MSAATALKSASAYEGAPRYSLSLVREPDTTFPAASDGGVTVREPAAAQFFMTRLACEPCEVMAALYLDTRHAALAWSILYRGTMDRASVEPRSILVAGLLCHAANLIICHNHPSGDVSPSAEDLAFTRRIAEAGEIVGVPLLDHVIVAGDNWLSLKEYGAW